MCFEFENVLIIYTFFFTFLTLDIRVLKSRLGQTAIALGLVFLFNTFHYIHAKVRLRAVSYFLSHSGQIAQSTHEGRRTSVI